MPVAGVLELNSNIDDLERDAVRECLRQIGGGDRIYLWLGLDALRGALRNGDVREVSSVLGQAPAGPIRECLVKVATPFLSRHRSDWLVHTNVAGVATTGQPIVRGHQRPDFMPPYEGLSGVVAPVEVWSNRTGLYFEKVEADAFGRVPTGKRWHQPVPLDWRHHAGVVLGCSRGFGLAADGSLLGTFDLGSHPAAQAAGRMAERGDLGLSMSVRFRSRWLVEVSPDEWSPHDGVMDVCVRDEASVEAVALTPAPAYPSATISRVW